MRMNRTLIAALAFALIGLVPFSTSATAAEPAATRAAAVAPTAAPVQAAAKPSRNVTMAFKKRGRVKYDFVGNVQDANKKTVQLMRADKRKGKYRVFRTVRTNAKGRYAFKGLNRVGWYAAKVPSDKNYRASASRLIHVFFV